MSRSKRAGSAISIVEVGPDARAELLQHFLALDDDDRLLRFNSPVRNPTIESYVDRIDFGRDTVFGVRGDQWELVGVGHFANVGDEAQARVAEYAISVLRSARGRGIATMLLAHAIACGSRAGVGLLRMHLLSSNAAMLHIAGKAGMRLVHACGETQACFEFPRILR